MNSKFKPFQKVLVRDNEENAWECAFYSHYIKEPDIPSHHHVCVGGEDWIYCIPYEGNEKLLNTNKSPESTLEFKFGDKVSVRDCTTDGWREGIFVKYQSSDSAYIVLSKYYNIVNEWKYCKRGWGDNSDS